MTALTANSLSLSALAQRHHDGDMLTIAEVLEKEAPMIQDAPWIEANDFFSNVGIRRASLPSGTWRKLNAGVANEKSETTQVRDVIGMLETFSKTDAKIVDSAANPQSFRMSEDTAFIQGLSQNMQSTMLYGNTNTDPEKFSGLHIRLASLATTTNVLNEGGTGSDLTSIFVVDWGEDRCHMLYPKGSKAGLQTEDLGKIPVTDASSNDFMAYCTHFMWDSGMFVKHPRAIGRIANIESAGTTNTFDEDNLITLLNRMTTGPGRRIYCNETVMTQAEIRLKDKTNVNWTTRDGLGGEEWMFFRGIPVRKIDSQILLNTEAALT